MRVRRRFLVFFSGGFLLFLGLVGAAVTLIDSPTHMKLRKNDDRRVADFIEVAEILLEHHKDGKVLPESLVKATRNDSTRNFMQDPVSGQVYDYRHLSQYEFELCAEFETSNIDYGYSKSHYFSGRYVDFGHDKGHACFSFSLLENKD